MGCQHKGACKREIYHYGISRFELHIADIAFVAATTGLASIGGDLTIQVENDEIVVSGTTSGTIVEVYSMGALLVGRHEAMDTQLRIRLEKGIYVVRVDNAAAKVAL